jgi:hypothetical protein
MANDYDYKLNRPGRDYYDAPHYRSRGENHEEPYYHGYGRSYYDLSHRGCGHGGYYNEPYSIEVSVNNCIVTLAGRLNSREEKWRAEDIAESVSGVTDVINQLRVGPSVPFTMETTETTRARTARA